MLMKNTCGFENISEKSYKLWSNARSMGVFDESVFRFLLCHRQKHAWPTLQKIEIFINLMLADDINVTLDQVDWFHSGISIIIQMSVIFTIVVKVLNWINETVFTFNIFFVSDVFHEYR